MATLGIFLVLSSSGLVLIAIRANAIIRNMNNSSEVHNYPLHAFLVFMVFLFPYAICFCLSNSDCLETPPVGVFFGGMVLLYILAWLLTYLVNKYLSSYCWYLLKSRKVQIGLFVQHFLILGFGFIGGLLIILMS